jgi:Protein of unknown function (DUF4019)
MKLAALILSILFALALWPQSASIHAQQKPEELAQKSAEAWLALSDSGKYGESWDQAASTFKGAISRDQWISQLTAVRTPLGKVESRKLAGAQSKSNPPNAPAGEYVVLQFSTTFENRKDSTETVAMFLDKDGKWHTAGYFIK